MGQMCSITKHCTPHPTACLSGCGCWCVCCHVYLLSCLYVVSSDALRSSVFTDFDFKGSCNQGKKVLDFYYSGVTRRHSFGKCVLTTLLKKVHSKKNLIKRQGFFHKPNQVFRLVELLTLGSGGSR